MNILSEKLIGTHGFVRLLGVFGSDTDICESARLSYAGATKKSISSDEQLIRYLMKHRHTSPFEQAEVRFGLKLPIFVMRQLVRHRTANLNEMSGRYSVLDTEFYLPNEFHYQSSINKQGSNEETPHELSDIFKKQFEDIQKIASTYYTKMIDLGVSKEIARCILPVNLYTECVWKCDLHNLFHFLKLRTDSHAQAEIREFADAMEYLVRPHFPLSFAAYDDYVKNARTLSAMELRVLSDKLSGKFVNDRAHYNMSDREWKELFLYFPSLDNT